MTIVPRLKRRIAREYTDRFVSDRAVIRRHYYRIFGRYPNLDDPVLFSEKIQWLKLNYRPPQLHKLVDKYAVREYVKERVGDWILNESLGVWNDADLIDIDALPGRFVIKGTHGSGMNLICQDKHAVNWAEARMILNRQLSRNYYLPAREWAYKHAPPRLIAEAFLGDDATCPSDYKFFCFNGVPRVILVALDRFGRHTCAIFDPEWRPLPFQLQHPLPPVAPSMPPNLQEMLEVARQLARGLPFVRVDLYSVEGRTVFGEMTFYPGNGMEEFTPQEWDATLGHWLHLPEERTIEA